MHNRRRSARRKLWQIVEYKDSEQHISDSDDEEEKVRTKYKKAFAPQFENNVLENWITCGSGFVCSNKKGFEREDKTRDLAYSSEEETLIETISCSDDDNPQSTQPSISEDSCTPENSARYYTKQRDNEDFHDDNNERLSPSTISNITENSQINLHSNEQVRNASYTISPPSSPIDSVSCSAKGSDWLLTIPWQPKSQEVVHPEFEIDSGKKKKKYTNGGFADQLHKLQSREKSAKAFWNHHSRDSKNLFCEKESMILELTEATCSYGTVICRANLLKSHQPNELILLYDSASCTNSDISLNTSDETNEEMFENYIILLDYDQYEELNLSAGSIVQLFPPWKVLRVSNLDVPVLLCTYFLKVVKRPDNLSTRKHPKQNGDVT